MSGKLLRTLVWAALFLAAYLALDRVSFIHVTLPVNITPWNPPAGLGLALLLVAGARAAPLFFVAMAAADLTIRGLPAPILASLAANFCVVLLYTGAALVLRRVIRMDPLLGGVRHALWLLAVTVVAAAAVALCFVGLFLLAGVLPAAEFWAAAGRYWIGDVIGIAVLTPAILLLRRRSHWPGWRVVVEMAAQGAAIGAALWLVLGRGAPESFQFFYVLFLPLIWAAARFGLDGAVMGNMAAQLGMMVVFRAEDAAIVTAFQHLMLALVAATLMLGAAVTERRRVEAVLYARQDDLAQVSRLSMAGEMAAALAHELNQPLLAAIAFTRAAQRLLAGPQADSAKALGAMDRAVAENQRAAEIVRSLRQFIGSGPIARDRFPASELVADALALAAPECARRGVRVVAQVDKMLPAVHVDRVQVQQVLLNLIRNAMDAMERGGEIIIAARTRGDSMEFHVADTGPGVGDDVAGRLFEPFNTSKATGMGLGLTISRSFVEAHGGRLWLERTGPDGTVFRFTLPLAGSRQQGEMT